MRIEFTITGENKYEYKAVGGEATLTPLPVWPEGWPVPRVGEIVQLENYVEVYVRTVIYMPVITEPCVYIVLGERRREGI